MGSKHASWLAIVVVALSWTGCKPFMTLDNTQKDQPDERADIIRVQKYYGRVSRNYLADPANNREPARREISSYYATLTASDDATELCVSLDLYLKDISRDFAVQRDEVADKIEHGVRFHIGVVSSFKDFTATWPEPNVPVSSYVVGNLERDVRNGRYVGSFVPLSVCGPMPRLTSSSRFLFLSWSNELKLGSLAAPHGLMLWELTD